MNLDDLNLNNNRRKKPPVDLSMMVYGKVPPQSVELEKVVLGAIMLEKTAFDKAEEILQPECFYLETHQRVFKAMQRLSRKSQPIDMLTVVEELKTTSDLEIVGGPYAVTKLTNDVVSSANLPAHCKVIYQKFVRREVIRISGEAIGDAYDDETDAFDLLEGVEQKYSILSLSQTAKQFETLGEVSAKAVKEIYAAQQTGAEVTGVACGIPVLDKITMGWQLTNLIIIAARPGVGKSALAGNFAFNAATNSTKPVPVGLFSLEMSSIQWVNRLLSGSTQVPMFDMKRGRIDEDQMKRIQNAALIEYPKIPIYFDDTASLDIYRLKSKARILVLRYKVGLIIVDYLQLMGGKRMPGENREQEVARISRELKQLAKELNIPIIALAQLSRQGDTGEPRLGHLRESGAIEQDADDVIFLSPVEEDAAAQDASLRDSILLHIAKHRNGILDKVPVKFVKAIQKLMTEEDYDRYMGTRQPIGATGGNWKPVPPRVNPGANFYEPKDREEETPF